MIRLIIIGVILFLLSGDVFGAQQDEDKEFQILMLKKLLAEQTLATLEEARKRVQGNLERLLKEIEEYEATKKEAKQ